MKIIDRLTTVVGELFHRPPPPAQPPRVAVDTSHRANLAKVDHIVVVLMENRSFDHMLGYLKLENVLPTVDGLEEGMANEHAGQSYGIHHLTETVFPGQINPAHGASAVDEQLSGANGGFVRNFARHNKPSDGGPAVDPGLVMGYYNASELPVYDFLARNYAVCDHWFSSVPGATWPNRLYALAGRAAGSRDDQDVPLYSLRSFVRHLDARRLGWRWYSYDPGTLRLVDRHYRVGHHENFAFVDRRAPSLRQRVADVLSIDEDNSFFDDVAHGHLPSVSWIDPNFNDLQIFHPLSNDDHPPADVHAGQELIFNIYRALTESSQWDKTMLVITYDEHGGLFDHVPPPTAPDDDPGFRRYGVRVPALVVSPWIEPGHVSKTIFDHTSLIKTVLLGFCEQDGTIPNMGLRTTEAHDLGELLGATTPRPDPDVRELVEIMATHRAASAVAPLRNGPAQSVRAVGRLDEFKGGVLEATRQLRLKYKLPAGRP